MNHKIIKLESHNIVNFISLSPSGKDFNKLKYKYSDSIIQIWISTADKNFRKLWSENIKNLFYPYCFGILEGKMYMIFRKFRLKYNVIECFKTYYDAGNIGKNVLILSDQVLQSFKTNVEKPNEISGNMTYTPILVNSAFSWKYIDRLDDTVFKMGTPIRQMFFTTRLLSTPILFPPILNKMSKWHGLAWMTILL